MPKRRYGKTYIREWREHRGLSLRRLADRLESDPGGEPIISHASIGRIEQGLQPYTQETLEAIALALNVAPADLLATDPGKEGEVIDLVRRLDNHRRSQAVDFLRFLTAG